VSLQGKTKSPRYEKRGEGELLDGERKGADTLLCAKREGKGRRLHRWGRETVFISSWKKAQDVIQFVDGGGSEKEGTQLVHQKATKERGELMTLRKKNSFVTTVKGGDNSASSGGEEKGGIHRLEKRIRGREGTEEN